MSSVKKSEVMNILVSGGPALNTLSAITTVLTNTNYQVEVVCEQFGVDADMYLSLLESCIDVVGISKGKEEGTPIEETNLGSREKNALIKSGIKYVEQLKNISYNKLKRIRNLGVISCGKIASCLKRDFNIEISGYEDFVKDLKLKERD